MGRHIRHIQACSIRLTSNYVSDTCVPGEFLPSTYMTNIINDRHTWHYYKYNILRSIPVQNIRDSVHGPIIDYGKEKINRLPWNRPRYAEWEQVRYSLAAPFDMCSASGSFSLFKIRILPFFSPCLVAFCGSFLISGTMFYHMPGGGGCVLWWALGVITGDAEMLHHTYRCHLLYLYGGIIRHISFKSFLQIYYCIKICCGIYIGWVHEIEHPKALMLSHSYYSKALGSHVTHMQNWINSNIPKLVMLLILGCYGMLWIDLGIWWTEHAECVMNWHGIKVPRCQVKTHTQWALATSYSRQS